MSRLRVTGCARDRSRCLSKARPRKYPPTPPPAAPINAVVVSFLSELTASSNFESPINRPAAKPPAAPAGVRIVRYLWEGRTSDSNHQYSRGELPILGFALGRKETCIRAPKAQLATGLVATSNMV